MKKFYAIIPLLIIIISCSKNIEEKKFIDNYIKFQTNKNECVLTIIDEKNNMSLFQLFKDSVFSEISRKSNSNELNKFTIVIDYNEKNENEINKLIKEYFSEDDFSKSNYYFMIFIFDENNENPIKFCLEYIDYLKTNQNVKVNLFYQSKEEYIKKYGSLSKK
jgi:hypothetical protein